MNPEFGTRTSPVINRTPARRPERLALTCTNPVIGLEIHAQLLTDTKIFCGCRTSFGAPPNTHVCPVCLGLPGALPVLNRAGRRSGRARRAGAGLPNQRALDVRPQELLLSGPAEGLSDLAIRPAAGAAAAASSSCRRRRRRTRRHHARAPGRGRRQVAARRLPGFATGTRYLDFNRSGVPLIEIVTEPDLRIGGDAAAVLRAACAICWSWLGVNDGNMEEGSLRCDANVSVRPAGAGDARHEGRGEEPELVPLSAAGARVRDRAADRGRRATAAASCRRRGSGTQARGARVVDAQQGRGARLPLLPGAGSAAARSSTRRASLRSARALPELPDARRGAVRGASTGCPSTTPAS